jgi:hypothetical protein
MAMLRDVPPVTSVGEGGGCIPTPHRRSTSQTTSHRPLRALRLASQLRCATHMYLCTISHASCSEMPSCCWRERG